MSKTRFTVNIHGSKLSATFTSCKLTVNHYFLFYCSCTTSTPHVLVELLVLLLVYTLEGALTFALYTARLSLISTDGVLLSTFASECTSGKLTLHGYLKDLPWCTGVGVQKQTHC